MDNIKLTYETLFIFQKRGKVRKAMGKNSSHVETFETFEQAKERRAQLQEYNRETLEEGPSDVHTVLWSDMEIMVN